MFWRPGSLAEAPVQAPQALDFAEILKMAITGDRLVDLN